jgi:hypothetical protein
MEAIHPNDPSLQASRNPVPGSPGTRATRGPEAPAGGRP